MRIIHIIRNVATHEQISSIKSRLFLRVFFLLYTQIYLIMLKTLYIVYQLSMFYKYSHKNT